MTEPLYTDPNLLELIHNTAKRGATGRWDKEGQEEFAERLRLTAAIILKPDHPVYPELVNLLRSQAKNSGEIKEFSVEFEYEERQWVKRTVYCRTLNECVAECAANWGERQGGEWFIKRGEILLATMRRGDGTQQDSGTREIVVEYVDWYNTVDAVIFREHEADYEYPPEVERHGQ